MSFIISSRRWVYERINSHMQRVRRTSITRCLWWHLVIDPWFPSAQTWNHGGMGSRIGLYESGNPHFKICGIHIEKLYVSLQAQSDLGSSDAKFCLVLKQTYKVLLSFQIFPMNSTWLHSVLILTQACDTASSCRSIVFDMLSTACPRKTAPKV